MASRKEISDDVSHRKEKKSNGEISNIFNLIRATVTLQKNFKNIGPTENESRMTDRRHYLADTLVKCLKKRAKIKS